MLGLQRMGSGMVESRVGAVPLQREKERERENPIVFFRGEAEYSTPHPCSRNDKRRRIPGYSGVLHARIYCSSGSLSLVFPDGSLPFSRLKVVSFIRAANNYSPRK